MSDFKQRLGGGKNGHYREYGCHKNRWPWDHVYVVNLERCKKRWLNIKRSLKKEGIDPNDARYNAIDGKKDLKISRLIKKGIADPIIISQKMRAGKIGAVAQHLTMAKIFKEALQRNYKQILFLEDDVLLISHLRRN